MHSPADEEYATDQCRSCGYIEMWEIDEYGPTFPCWTLKAVALPYAGHEDYQPEWALDDDD